MWNSFFVVILGLAVVSCRTLDKMKCKADIAFVVDSSSSIWEEDFKLQKQFIADVVSRFDIGPDDVQISAVSFSNDYFDEFKFNDHSDAKGVLAAVRNIKYSEGDATRTYLALNRTRTNLFGAGNGARADALHVAVVMTDGVTNPGGYDGYSSNVAKAETQREAETARSEGIYIFAVGIGRFTDLGELQGIANDPDGKFLIEVDSYSELNTDKIKNQLAYRACYAPTTPAPPTTTTPEPTTPKDDPKEICQGKPADVVFLLDSSTSINSRDNFKKELTFVNNIIDYFDISPTKTQVSVITFSDTPSLRFPLNQYPERDSLKAAVNGINWARGNTFTDKALKMLVNKGFSKRNGARKGVAQIGIVITDGNSTNPWKTEEEAQTVLNRGIIMFAIGVGQVYRPELEIMASEPSSMYVKTVENLDALNTVKKILAYQVCKEKEPIDPDEVCQNKAADIVFIADASTSIGSSDFQLELNFIADLVDKFDVRRDGTRVGLVKFGNASNIEFGLDSFTSAAEIKKALSTVTYSREMQLTYTAEAIQMMTRNVFNQARGGNIPKIGIIITDGGSREPLKTLQAAGEAKQQGINLFTIGVGKYISKDELLAVASDPDDYFSHMVGDFSSFGEIDNLLAKNTCNAGSFKGKRGLEKKSANLGSKALKMADVFKHLRNHQ